MKKLFYGIGYVIAALLYSAGLLNPTTSVAQEVAIEHPLQLSSEPDLPTPFGYKSVWFAVKTEDTSAVFSAFNLQSEQPANWASGIKFLYDFDSHFKRGEKPVFVSPPVSGWTLILAGLNFSADSSEKTEYLRNLLNRLSKEFGEAQYFGSYRVVGYVAWYRSISGSIERGFSFADGTLFANEGNTSEAELEIGYFDMSGMDEANIWETLMEAEEEGEYFFDEEDPMKIAELWSVNPLSVDQEKDLEPSIGLVGFHID